MRIVRNSRATPPTVTATGSVSGGRVTCAVFYNAIGQSHSLAGWPVVVLKTFSSDHRSQGFRKSPAEKPTWRVAKTRSPSPFSRPTRSGEPHRYRADTASILFSIRSGYTRAPLIFRRRVRPRVFTYVRTTRLPTGVRLAINCKRPLNSTACLTWKFRAETPTHVVGDAFAGHFKTREKSRFERNRVIRQLLLFVLSSPRVRFLEFLYVSRSPPESNYFLERGGGNAINHFLFTTLYEFRS